MKAILVVLLVIGAVSAVPLKAPKYNIQDLLTQQNVNTLLEQIQQNQDLYESFITTIESILLNFDFESTLQLFFQDSSEIIQQFIQPILGDIFILLILHPDEAAIPISIMTSFIDHMQNLDLEFTDDDDDTFELKQFIQIAFSAIQYIFAHPDDVQELVNFANNYFSVDQFISSLFYAFVSNFSTVIIAHLGGLSQQFFQEFIENFDIQQFLAPEAVFEILMFCISNLDDAAIPISFLTSLGINYFNVFGQLYAGTFNPEQFMTPQIVNAAFQWTVAHQNEVHDLVNFFKDYLPVDQITGSLVTTLLNILPNFVTNILSNFLPAEILRVN